MGLRWGKMEESNGIILPVVIGRILIVGTVRHLNKDFLTKLFQLCSQKLD